MRACSENSAGIPDGGAVTDGLATLALRADLADGTDLEHVWVVPALAQRRVGEDELQLRLEAQQPPKLSRRKLALPIGFQLASKTLRASSCPGAAKAARSSSGISSVTSATT